MKYLAKEKVGAEQSERDRVAKLSLAEQYEFCAASKPSKCVQSQLSVRTQTVAMGRGMHELSRGWSQPCLDSVNMGLSYPQVCQVKLL